VINGTYLVPRRSQFESAQTVNDQLSAQMAQDPTFPLDTTTLEVLANIEPYGTIEIAEISDASAQSTPSPHSPYHISVTYKPSDLVHLSLMFDSRFHEKDMQYILDHLVSAIQQLLVDPTLSYSQLNLMSPQELDFVQHLPCLAHVNGFTPEDPYQYRYAFELLSRPLKAHPDNVAVEWENVPVYTFKTLEAASNQLARYLMDRFGVRPGDIVMIFSAQSPVAIVALYAILKIGAAYFPLDPDIPPALFQRTVGLTNSSLFLTIGELESKLQGLGWDKRIVSVDTSISEWSLLDDKPIEHNPPLGDPQKMLAYLNTTSGSTGTPKIIMISQSNLVHFIVEVAPAWGRSTETRFSQVRL
jgi:non-ribosomal peptide synthetase component F